jgi:hypothetical protein
MMHLLQALQLLMQVLCSTLMPQAVTAAAAYPPLTVLRLLLLIVSLQQVQARPTTSTAQ